MDYDYLVKANYKYLYSWTTNKFTLNGGYLSFFLEGQQGVDGELTLFPCYGTINDMGCAAIFLDGHSYNSDDINKIPIDKLEEAKKRTFGKILETKMVSRNDRLRTVEVWELGTATNIIHIEIFAIDTEKSRMIWWFPWNIQHLKSYVDRFISDLAMMWNVANYSDIQNLNNDAERDNRIIGFWQHGYTAKEIGEIENLSHGRIHNIISELRKKLGSEVIPYHSGK